MLLINKIFLIRRKKNLLYLLLCYLVLASLTACHPFRSSYYSNDGPPPNRNVDYSHIPDAVPKAEPLSPYGNKSPYVVNGKRYYVLRSARGYNQRGIASWYGTKFHGQLTSTREQYNLYAMTAASPILPLPTYVYVTNLENGRHVIVKVNDRGPFEGGRIMDFSYAAAQKLGFANKGTTHVQVTAINPRTFDAQPRYYAYQKTQKPADPSSDETEASSSSVIPPKGDYIQVGAFANADRARQLSRQIAYLTNKTTYIDKNTTSARTIYRVEVGPVSDLKEEEQLINVIEAKGYGHPLIHKIA